MSVVEIAVIVAAGLVGWFVVSFVINQSNDTTPSFEGKSWHEILRVSPSADLDTIERAYAARQQQLDSAAPRILTEAEQQSAQRRQQQLDSALAEARAHLARHAD